VVLDTCIAKLATFPASENPAAVIVELGLRKVIEWWVSPAILEEYGYVLSDQPEFLADVFNAVEQCLPLTELSVIDHEPDNRFIECALAVSADYLVTVNTARGHFDKARYAGTRVVTPGRFLAAPRVRRSLHALPDAQIE
jgi:predicted nucleic acid-binding protein